jgi:hypothetical protein
MCLQYAIWALAAYINEKYTSYADIFYQRARKYAEADEMKVSSHSEVAALSECVCGYLGS